MGWLRIDDGFMENPKIEQLTAHELQVWMRVLCRCARQRSGQLQATSIRYITGLTKQRVQRLVDLGLLDAEGDAYIVHDWSLYNGATVFERVEAYLRRYPDATASEVHRAIGGKRTLVLEAVKQSQTSGSQGGSPIGSRTSTQTGSPSGSQTGTPRARARSRPVPEEPSLLPSVPNNATTDNGRTDGDLTRLDPHQELPAWTP